MKKHVFRGRKCVPKSQMMKPIERENSNRTVNRAFSPINVLQMPDRLDLQ
jgi:hypothetical protein